MHRDTRRDELDGWANRHGDVQPEGTSANTRIIADVVAVSHVQHFPVLGGARPSHAK